MWECTNVKNGLQFFWGGMFAERACSTVVKIKKIGGVATVPPPPLDSPCSIAPKKFAFHASGATVSRLTVLPLPSSAVGQSGARRHWSSTRNLTLFAWGFVCGGVEGEKTSRQTTNKYKQTTKKLTGTCRAAA